MGIGLIAAGMISGAGAGASKGLEEAAKINIEQERQKYDTIRQDKQLAASQAMHSESLAATHAEGEATRGTSIILEGRREEAASKRQKEQLDAAHEEGAAHRDLQLNLAREGIIAHKELNDASLDQAQKQFDATLKLHKDQFQFEKGKVHALPLSDGTVAMYTPQGKVMGIMMGTDGQPLHVPGDLTKAQQARVQAYVALLADNSREYARNGATWTPDQISAHKAEQTKLLGQIESETGKPPAQKGPSPSFNFPTTMNPHATPAAAAPKESLVDAGTKKPSAPVHPGRYATKDQQAKYDSDMVAWQAGKPVAPTFPGKYASAQERGKYEIALAEYEAAQSTR